MINCRIEDRKCRGAEGDIWCRAERFEPAKEQLAGSDVAPNEGLAHFGFFAGGTMVKLGSNGASDIAFACGCVITIQMLRSQRL